LLNLNNLRVKTQFIEPVVFISSLYSDTAIVYICKAVGNPIFTTSRRVGISFTGITGITGLTGIPGTTGITR
jgi:hypothetical protein